MSSIKVDVIGFDKLTAQLKKLSDDKDKRRETLAILRELARPTIQAAKQIVPVSRKPHLVSGKRTREVIHPGALKKSIGTITGRRAKNPTIYAGPRAKGNFDGWYGHFVHDGHEIFNERKSVFTREANGRIKTNTVSAIKNSKKKGSVSQGRTRANPFMTMAYQATEGVVTADAEKRMARFIQRKIDKLS